MVACQDESAIRVFDNRLGTSGKTGPEIVGFGTDTGNPMESRSFAVRVAQLLCENVAKCNSGIDNVACVDSVKNLQGTALEMGYTSSSSLSDVVVDSDARYSETNLQACLAAVENLPCESDIKLEAYTSNSPNNFNNVSNLLQASDSCVSINDPSGELVTPPPDQNPVVIQSTEEVVTAGSYVKDPINTKNNY
jgi:hypothetical protein